MPKPVSVSNYKLSKVLSENLRGNLPTVEEIEAGLNHYEIKN